MSRSTTYIIVGAVALGAAYLLLKKKSAPVYNAAPVGAYGAVSHSAATATGGSIAALGSVLGSSIAGWFGGGSTSPASVPVDRNTPYLGSGTITNPVVASPAVLPYSYKQQTIDTPMLLGTDDLFTPSYDGSGSSGGYSDANTGSSDILNYGF